MRLSLVMPFYRNQGMLRRHLQVWRDEWPADLKSAVDIVLVDDGSPTETAAEVLRDADLTGLPPIALYRVTEDRPWHQHGARNLGAHVARGPWLLMTDMDHIIPADTLAEVLRLIASAKGGRTFTFGRVDAPADRGWTSRDWPTMARTLNRHGAHKPHVNSFCLPRALYWRIGGYHETVGAYGTDAMFRRRLWSAAKEIHLPDRPLIRVSREVIPDASTATLDRDEGRAVRNRIKAEMPAKPVTLDFPWERVL